MERPRNTVPSARTSTAAWAVDVIWVRMRKAGEAGGPPASLKPGLYAQAQHIAHAVKPGLAAFEELRCAQGAGRVRRAALRAHRHLHALAQAREQHRVLADDVAAAHRVKADGFGVALAGVAQTPVLRDLGKLAIQRLRHDFA